jgi:hypothetical protein
MMSPPQLTQYRAAFYERDIILVHLHGQAELPEWKKMDECLSMGINIETQYPSCSYLSRCLLSPSGDPIAGLVYTMSLISSSSKLSDISRLFCEVSKSLKGVSTTKAAILLKPLQNKAIFPVITISGTREYNTLLDMNDKSWFIVDELTIRDSFQGKLPLLALPIKDLPALEDLFYVLRLEGRKVSRLVTSRTNIKGHVRMNWFYTNSLRAKAPFLKT